MKIMGLVLMHFLCIASALISACSNHKGLEGTWVGCDVRKPLIEWTLTISDNNFYLVREDLSMWYVGKFNLNNNCLLKKIDLKYSNSHILIHNETEQLGVYEIDGNSLTLITTKPGNHFRPSSLDENDKAVVFNFVRS